MIGDNLGPLKKVKLKNEFLTNLEENLYLLEKNNPKEYKVFSSKIYTRILNVLICLEINNLREFETRKRNLFMEIDSLIKSNEEE